MPIWIRLSILMPIQIRILPSFTLDGKSEICLDFFLQQSEVSFFIFLCRCHNFFHSILKFFGKKFSLRLHLVELDTDPDRQALDADPTLPKYADSIGP